MHTHMQGYVHTHMPAYAYMYRHIPTYTFIHAHTHTTHTLTRDCKMVFFVFSSFEASTIE
jgi:hypothetical protein